MFHTLYNTGIAAFGAGLRAAASFNPRAALFVEGRKQVWNELDRWTIQHPKKSRRYWFHCASLGEFEQGRPVMEALRQNEPEAVIVLTFFSPSGYEVRKNYSGANLVLYLPLDTPDNARRFVRTMQPDVAVFVKYEYWANYFFALKEASVPLLVISAIFRENQRFFGWQRSFWKQVLGCVDHFFVQTAHSAALLKGLGFVNYTLAGDTRFDRVLSIAGSAGDLPEAKAFCGDFPVVIAGSSYATEEEVLIAMVEEGRGEERLILVPHEVDAKNVERLTIRCAGKAVRWSQYDGTSKEKRILIVDEIGYLSSLYHHAHVAVIGGGFGKGIHNTLEAAVYGIPLVFGPGWEKFDEARGLIEAGGAVSVREAHQLSAQVRHWLDSHGERKEAGEKAGQYVRNHAGALKIILAYMARMTR